MTTQGVPTPGPSAEGALRGGGDDKSGDEHGQAPRIAARGRNRCICSPRGCGPAGPYRRSETSGSGPPWEGAGETGRRHRTAAGRDEIGPAAVGGGQGRGRTADLPIFSRSLVPTELPGQAAETLPQGCRAGKNGRPGTAPPIGRARPLALCWSGSQGVARCVRGRWPPSSSGLGRRPFTAVARVRIPLGVRVLARLGGTAKDGLEFHRFTWRQQHTTWPRSAVG